MRDYGLAWNDLVDRPPKGSEILWLDAYRQGETKGLRARTER